MPVRCQGGGVNQGAEGEVCNVSRQCDGVTYGISCTHDFAHATYACSCQKAGAAGRSFFAKFAACNDLADEDFLNDVCGFHLLGDGSEPSVTLVDNATDPTFPPPALTECNQPTAPALTDPPCVWTVACSTVTLTLSCMAPQNTADTDCTCSVDDRPEQAFAVQSFLAVGAPACPTVDLAWLSGHCGWSF